MAGAPTPQTLFEPIASDASGGFITNPIPETPTGTNAASIQQGFPGLTMQQKIAGGEPPNGQDMNGFLLLISGHTFYVQCGQLYPFNADLVAEIGGYSAGAVIAMADNTGAWLNLADGNSADPDSGNPLNWVPLFSYGTSNVAVTGGGGAVNFTNVQFSKKYIKVTGALTRNTLLVLPALIGDWYFINSTTGAFTLSAQMVSSGLVVIPQSGPTTPKHIYSPDGANLYGL